MRDEPRHDLRRRKLVIAIPVCGVPLPVGGNTPPQSPPQNTPPVAADPYDLFVAYVQAMVATMLDTSEPTDVAAFDPPPTSETKEPVATQ